MNHGCGQVLRVAAVSVLLTFAVTEIGCVSKPQPLAETPSREKSDVSPTLRAKEGLTFRLKSATDGANTDPRFDATEYAASDGETVASEWHSFKHREDAVKFYSDALARARTVLERSTQVNDLGNTDTQRAVIEFVTNNGRSLTAVVELKGSSVNEIIGPTVGHVLAYEKRQEVNR